MYHCHLRFYLVGRHRSMFEQIKEIAPLAHFTHEFLESEGPEESLAEKADVILADVREMDAPGTARMLAAAKRQDAALLRNGNT